MEYTDAKDCLLQASRKAPLHAMGFRIACAKWSIIVRLLLGEIPERTTFTVEGMTYALQPYFELTNVGLVLYFTQNFPWKLISFGPFLRLSELETWRCFTEPHRTILLSS